EHGIDPSTLTGTGEGGRVTRDDVLAFVQKGGTAGPSPAVPVGRTSPPSGEEPRPSPPQPSPPSGDESREELVRITAVRRSIAEHMTRSLATSPHAWTL